MNSLCSTPHSRGSWANAEPSSGRAWRVFATWLRQTRGGQPGLLCGLAYVLFACLAGMTSTGWIAGQPPANDEERLKIRQVYVPESRLVEFMQGRPAYLPLSAEKFREILAGSDARVRATCRGEPVRHSLIIGPGGSLQGQSLVRLRASAANGVPLAGLPTGPTWVEFDQWTVPAEYFNLVPQVTGVRDVGRETGRETIRSAEREAGRPVTRDAATPWVGFLPPGLAWQEVPVTLSVNEQGSFGLPLSQASEWMLVRYSLALATQNDSSGRRQLRLPNLPTTLTTVQTSGPTPTPFFVNGTTTSLQWVPTAAELSDAEKWTSRQQYFGDGQEFIGQFMEFDSAQRPGWLPGRYTERSSLTVERTLQRFEGVVDLELRQPYTGELVLELPANMQVTRCEVNGVSQACHFRNLDANTKQWVLPWQQWTARHEIRVAGVLNVDTPERIVIPRLRLAGHTWMSGAVQVAVAAPLSLVDYELIDGRVLRSQALGRVQDLSFQWGSPDSTVTLLLEVPTSVAAVANTPNIDFTRLSAESEKLEADQYLIVDDRFRDSNVVTWEVADGWQIEQVAAFDPASLPENSDQPLPESGLTPLNWSLLWEDDRPRIAIVLPAESRENRLGLRLRAVQPVSQWPLEVAGRVVQEISPGTAVPRPCLVQVVSKAGIRPGPQSGNAWSGLTAEDARQRLPELRGLIGAGNLRLSDGQTRLLLEDAAGQSGGYDVLAHTYNHLLPQGLIQQGHRFLIQPNGPVDEVRLSGGGAAHTARRWQTFNQTGQPLEHEVGPAAEGEGWSLRFRRPVSDPFILVVQQTWLADSAGSVPLYQFPLARQFQGGIDSTSSGPQALQIRAANPLLNPAAELQQFRLACRQWWRDTLPAVDQTEPDATNRPSTYNSTWYGQGSELQYHRVARLEWTSPTLLLTRQIDTWHTAGWQTELQVELHCDAATSLSVLLPEGAVCNRVLLNQQLAIAAPLRMAPRLEFPGPGRYTVQLNWSTPRPTTLASWSGWESLPPAHPLLQSSVAAQRELRLPAGDVPYAAPPGSDLVGTWGLGQRLLSPLIWPRQFADPPLSNTVAAWQPLEPEPSGYHRWRWIEPRPLPDSADSLRRESNRAEVNLSDTVADQAATDAQSVDAEQTEAASLVAGPLFGRTELGSTHDRFTPRVHWVFRTGVAHHWHWTALLCGSAFALALRRRRTNGQPADNRGIHVALVGGVALAWLLPWPWHEWVASVWLGVLLGDAWQRLWASGQTTQAAGFEHRSTDAPTRSGSQRRLLTPTGVAWLLAIGCWGSQLYASRSGLDSLPTRLRHTPASLQDEETTPEARPYSMVVIPVDEQQRPVGPVVYVPPDLYTELNRSPLVDRGSFDLERRGAQHTLEYDPQLRRFSRLTSLYTCKATTAKSYLLPSPVGPEHAIRQVRLNGVPVLFQRLRDGISIQMDVGTNLLSITYDLQLTQSSLQLDQHGLIDSYVVLSGVPNSWQAVVTDRRFPQTRFRSPIQRRFRTDRFHGTRVEVFQETENWSNPTIETWLSFDPLQVRCETRLRLGSAAGLRNELWFQTDPRMSLPTGYSAEAATWTVQRVSEDQRPGQALAGPVYRLQWSENHNPEQIIRIPWEYQSQSFGRLIPPTWTPLEAEFLRFRRMLVVQVDSRLVFRTLELNDSPFRRGNELELMSAAMPTTAERQRRTPNNRSTGDNSNVSAAVASLPDRSLESLADNRAERSRSTVPEQTDLTTNGLPFREPGSVQPGSGPAEASAGGAAQATNPGLDPTSRMAAAASNLFVYEQFAELNANHRTAIGRLSLQPTQVTGNLSQDLILAANSATLQVRGELQVTHGELSQAVFQLPSGGKLQRLALLSAQQNEVAWVAPRRGSESDWRAAFLRAPLYGTMRVELDVQLPLPTDKSSPLPWVQLPGFPEVSHILQVQDPAAAWRIVNELGEPAVEAGTPSANPPVVATTLRLSESAEGLRALQIQPVRSAASNAVADVNPPSPPGSPHNHSAAAPGDREPTHSRDPGSQDRQSGSTVPTQPEILAGRFVLQQLLDLQHRSESAVSEAISRLSGTRVKQNAITSAADSAGSLPEGIVTGWQQLVVRNRGLDHLTLVIPPGWSVRRAWLDDAPALAVPPPITANATALEPAAGAEGQMATVALDPLQEYSILTLELVGEITSQQPELRWISLGTPLSLPCESAVPGGWPAELRLKTTSPQAVLLALANPPDELLQLKAATAAQGWGAELPPGHSMTDILQRPWPELPPSEESLGPALFLVPPSVVSLPATESPEFIRWASGFALLGLAVWLAAGAAGGWSVAWRWPGRPGTAPVGGDLLWLGLAVTAWAIGGSLALSALFASLGVVFFLQRLKRLGFLRRFA